MFEDRTQEQIKKEMLADIDQETGLSPMAGSYADATVGAAARQISEFYQALPAVVSMLFVDETSGGYLDLVGQTYFNITRRPGTKARCGITLTGSAGAVIPAGTLFLTATGLQFAMMEAVTIPEGGTANGVLEAAQEGADYNVGPGAIVSMFVNLPGLTSFSNQQASGGTDTESDAALLQRIQERRQKPINGTNGWQYRAWAMSVPGVGDAKVVELAEGAGTVGVTLVDSTMAPASPEIVEECKTLIDSQRPVGATVTVSAPTPLEVNVAAVVVISSATSAEAVETAFQERLAEYLAGLIREKYDVIYYAPEDDKAYTVIYNRILALLLTVDGVINATSLTVNGGTADTTVQPDQVPVIGSLEVTT